MTDTPRNNKSLLIAIVLLISFMSIGSITTIGNTINAVQNVISNGAPHIDVRAYGASGDGITDDTTAINNALAGSRSKTVSCAGGVFNVTTLNIPAHTSFVGNGNCTLRWYKNVSQQTAMLQNTNQDSGLGIDTDITISGITFDDRGFSPGNTRGIYFKNVSDARIINNNFKNFTHAIAGITSNSNLLIEGNNFNGFGNDTNGDAITLTGGTFNSRIVNNFLNTTHGETYVDGIVIDDTSTGIPVQASHNNIISGNTINGTGVGIVIEGSNNNTVSDNTITGTSIASISLSEGQGNEAPNNTIVSGNMITPLLASDGIRIIGHGTLVDGNTITGGDNGIFLNDISDVNSPNKDISIKNNQISYSANTAIYLDECESCVVQGNSVANTSSMGIRGVAITGNLVDISISGNKVSKSKFYGIDVESNNYMVDKIDISDNRVYESGWGTAATYEAIFASKGTAPANNFTILNNVISSNQTAATEKAGIYIHASIPVAIYSGNYMITQNNAINLYSNGYTSRPTFAAPRGTVLWNATPAAGFAPGWINVDGGTTWKQMANLES